MEVFDYKNSIVSLSNSILKHFLVSPFHETLKDVDDLLKKENYQNIIVLLCDGLGSKNLKDCLSKNDFLRKNKIRDITSVFPPTTTAATTSFITGKYPSEHNWYGWNMYFKDTDEIISLYLNKVKETNEKPKLDVLKRKYMNYISIIDLINETENEAYEVSPFSINNSCKNLDEVLERIKILCKKPKKKFIYAYIENPDKLMHQHGIYSMIVKKEIKTINEKLENIVKELKNTIIFIIADHGLVKTKYINLATEYKEIYDNLERTTTIESRACGIKLKKNTNKKEFKKLFLQKLGDKFTLLSVNEVLESHLFGENENNYLKNTIGDYLAIAIKEYSLNYNNASPIFKANHAGLTKDELLVPLIVIDSNEYKY